MAYQITSTSPTPTLNFQREDYQNARSMAHKRKRRSPYDIVYEKAAKRVDDYLRAIEEALETEADEQNQI